jgi:signal transduction histidine kinase
MYAGGSMTAAHSCPTVSQMRTSSATRLTRQDAVDVMLATAVVAAELIGATTLLIGDGAGRALDPIGYLLIVANGAALALRNRHPSGVLLAVAVTALAYTLLDYPGPFYTIALVFAVWAAVAAGQRLMAIVVTAVLFAATLVAGIVYRVGHLEDPAGVYWFTGWLVAGFVMGEVSRARRETLAQLEQRALEAEHTREEEARRRAGEERLRIARELHDVLAHSISVINVQAGVAVHLLDKQPEHARSALVAISQASKDALRELRATLGVLRQVDEADARGPAPGLAGLDDLVGRTSRAGLAVAVDRDGDARQLPPATDLAAYRIIQESLTNVARHSEARRATVSIHYGSHDVVIQVDDDGLGATANPTPDGGHGLLGMRERALAAGGELEAGPRPEGGFRVRARLPAEAGS